MKIKFIQNVLDNIRGRKHIENLENQLFELYQILNAKEQYNFKKMEELYGFAISEGSDYMSKVRENFFPNLQFLIDNEDSNFDKIDNYIIFGAQPTKTRMKLA